MILAAILLSLAALLVNSASADPVGAQDSDADVVLGVTLVVRGGVDGLYRPGRPVPIDVEIEAEQLLSAVLEVRSEVGSQTIEHRAEIEVPAGSTKRFVVAVPTPTFESADITVALEVDGSSIERQTVTLDQRSDVEFVGVLPLVASPADLPPTAALAVDAGTAVLQPISPELLGAGFDGLWIFDSLVVTAADLDALSNREADAVVGWTSAGGHLLVDETAGPVPRIPSSWQPAPNLAAPAGAGLIRLVDGQAKAGNWDEFLLPSAIDGPEAAGDLDAGRFSGQLHGSLSGELSRDAGFDLPPITDLLALFAVYALVVGPISFVILRRRRNTTALWLTVPALALIATVGVWFMGSELRGNTSAAHATVVITADGVDFATTHVLVDRSVEGIRVPRGWVPTGRVGNAAYEGEQATVEIKPTQAGYDATFDLDVGQFAISSARGTLAVDGVAVTASSDRNGAISGEVHNATGVEIHHVTVVSGPEAQDLGTLEPGDRRPFELDDADRFDFETFERRAWQEAAFTDPNLTVGIWNASLQERGGVNATPLGVVTAMAWTDALAAPVETRDGDPIGAGHTLLVTHAPVTPAGELISNMTLRGQLVRGPADTELGRDAGDVITGVYQLLVPEGFADGEVMVHVPRFATEVQIWRDDAWRAVPGGSEEERDVRITGDGLTIDGVLHLRFAIDRAQVFEFGNGDVLSAYQEAR